MVLFRVNSDRTPLHRLQCPFPPQKRQKGRTKTNGRTKNEQKMAGPRARSAPRRSDRRAARRLRPSRGRLSGPPRAGRPRRGAPLLRCAPARPSGDGGRDRGGRRRPAAEAARAWRDALRTAAPPPASPAAQAGLSFFPSGARNTTTSVPSASRARPGAGAVGREEDERARGASGARPRGIRRPRAPRGGGRRSAAAASLPALVGRTTTARGGTRGLVGLRR